jgi:hypothetical protein
MDFCRRDQGGTFWRDGGKASLLTGLLQKVASGVVLHEPLHLD